MCNSRHGKHNQTAFPHVSRGTFPHKRDPTYSTHAKHLHVQQGACRVLRLCSNETERRETRFFINESRETISSHISCCRPGLTEECRGHSGLSKCLLVWVQHHLHMSESHMPSFCRHGDVSSVRQWHHHYADRGGWHKKTANSLLGKVWVSGEASSELNQERQGITLQWKTHTDWLQEQQIKISREKRIEILWYDKSGSYLKVYKNIAAANLTAVEKSNNLNIIKKSWDFRRIQKAELGAGVIASIDIL